MSEPQGLEPLFKYATARQSEILKTIIEEGTQKAAAGKMGISLRAVEKHLQKMRTRAARCGYAPEHDMTHTVPDGFNVRGVSTLYNCATGKPTSQWVKSGRDNVSITLEALKEAVDDIVAPISGVYQPTPPPKLSNSDLMNCYPISDPHIGLFSWEEETGKNQDTDSVIKTIVDTMSALIDRSPPADTALIVNLADFFHSDTQLNHTLAGGNRLDVDTRWSRIYVRGTVCYRKIIEMALAKHKKVIVRSARGNHDEHLSFTLAVHMAAYFEKEPRVEIEIPYNHFSYVEFGKNLIGINHGKLKPNQLHGVMAQDKAKAWGRTLFRKWLVGHVHHETVVELPGCTVESFKTPTGNDAHHHNAGYRSMSEMQQITLHKKYGEVSRQKIAIL